MQSAMVSTTATAAIPHRLLRRMLTPQFNESGLSVWLNDWNSIHKTWVWIAKRMAIAWLPPRWFTVHCRWPCLKQYNIQFVIDVRCSLMAMLFALRIPARTLVVSYGSNGVEAPAYGLCAVRQTVGFFLTSFANLFIFTRYLNFITIAHFTGQSSSQ